MNSLLLKKAQEIEKANREKALKIAEVIQKQIEIVKETDLAPYRLYLGSHMILFDTFEVVNDELKDHWTETPESIESYIRLRNNVRVWFYVYDGDSSRRGTALITLYEDDELINDEHGFLELKKK